MIRIPRRTAVACFLLTLLLVVPSAWAVPPTAAVRPAAPPAPAGPVDYMVEITADTSPTAVATAAGMEIVSRSLVNPSWYFMRPVGQMSRSEAVAVLESVSGVTMVAGGGPGAPTRMSLPPPAPFTPNDPYFYNAGGGVGNPGQWHLVNSHTAGRDVNIQPAWNRGLTGQGVVIGIVDDSLQTTHPDLAPNYRAALSWDFGQNDPDPNPVTTADRHGISVAGVAAARGGNGIGVTGAAPEAGLAGLRIDFENWSDQFLVDATLWRDDAIKVKNHSYEYTGPFYPTDSWVVANRQSAAEGVINVRAAGNDRVTTYDGYALNWGNANTKASQADRTALTVAALGSNGKFAYYSNFGACVFVTAPSSGASGTYGITTTDRLGTLGYNTGADSLFTDVDYTRAFGGTSSSTPLVAGIVALMLQANPDLDIRSVKDILARTSRKIDPANTQWSTNGAGLPFNPNYGFGLIDSDAATLMAASYTPMPTEVAYSTGTVTVNQFVADNVATGVNRTFHLAGPGQVETVEIQVNVTHDYAGDLYIRLASPSGMTSELAYDHMIITSDVLSLDWTFSSAAFWGESVTGDWTLHVSDRWEGLDGYWNTFNVTAYAGVPEPATLALVTVGVLALLRRRRR